MASNTQIVANIRRTNRPGKRIWIGILAAIALVTLPVLPLKFLGIPGPDFDWRQVEDFGHMIIGKIPTMPARPEADSGRSERALTSDIKLMDATVKTLLMQLSKKPNDPSLHNRIGLVYAELGEPHSAVTHLEESIKLSRQSIKRLTKESNLAVESGDITKASNFMIEVSALNVQLAAAHSSLARVYEQLGKSDRVIGQLTELSKDISLSKAMKQSVEEGSSATGIATSGSQLDSETAAILARADALRQAGRNLEALQDYKRLAQKVPNLALVHKELGLTALAMRNLWLAQEELGKAVKLDSRDATAHSALGSIYQQIGEADRATEEYEKAIKINGKDFNAAFNLGNMYASSNQYDKAIAAFQTAVSARPEFALAHNNLATMYSFNGDYVRAADEFRLAISLSPNLASAYYGLGIACLNEKHYAESARAFKRAIALNPDLIDAHNKLQIAQKKAHAQGQTRLN